jgi:AraC-like DNA-binding protein
MITKINNLDNFEILSINNQKKDFPKHFHETFCISLIEQGVEVMDTNDSILYSEKGSISITNPYEVHSNPLLNKDIPISFTTLYVSQDLVNYCLKEKNVKFQNSQLFQPSLISLFYEVKKSLDSNNPNLTQKNLSNLFNLLNKSSDNKNTFTNDFSKWEEIVLFIENNLEEKLSIDGLAYFMNMEKFGFARQFRSKFGMSPINYVLMKRVFAAKKQITSHSELTALAYQFGFADQAHFSKTFKRFIGIAPNEYKKTLK